MSRAFTRRCSLAMLQRRAHLYRDIRAFFLARDVLEVEVPLLGASFVTDPYIEPIIALCNNRPYYLQSSPEYAMKRLLASGSQSIYTLGKAFRHAEQGRRHNPEFTLLEWYRLGFDEHALMAELRDLVLSVMPAIDVQKLSYRDWFTGALGLDPHCCRLADLQAVAALHIDIDPAGLSRDDWLDLLVSHVLEPRLPAGLTFIYDYPASQAALARIVPDSSGQPVARRFEAFLGGMELANGYWELTDAAEQRRRFSADIARRRELGLPEYAADEKLLEAMDAGLPECAGVALGVDRLLLQLTGATHIEQTLAFDFARL